MNRLFFLWCIGLCLLMPTGVSAATPPPKNAEAATRAANERVRAELPFDEQGDFEDARRGFIAGPDSPHIKNAFGRVVFSLTPYAFIASDRNPETVNPSLWRQARLNMEAGLFKVCDRVYQVRGLDISNMTIIEGDTGLIIIDPLLSAESASAALNLYYQHVPAPEQEGEPRRRPVLAVVYTHSHSDHYGGVKGVITEADVASGRTMVLAPEGFMEAAVSENIFAGTAMSRRAMYMYGTWLPRGEKGQLDAGLGKATSTGTQTLIPPTDMIRRTGEQRTIDGVDIEFQLALETEAPSEMFLYFPQFKALCLAEDATHTLHNLYTLRGAQVRDANSWWKALDASLKLYADRTEVLFTQHHWPHWGGEDIRNFLTRQRNAYKFIHDQSLRLANLGYGPEEISESLRFPASLASQWHLRDYYGTLKHNAKAVYQRYLGWYSGHPADLDPLPPVEAAKQYVDFMGGSARVLTKARESYAKGEFRWVAEVLKHVVFADPKNLEARELQADALEQLGYQAESAPWRNVYLSGAHELRNGPPEAGRLGGGSASRDVLEAMTDEMTLDYLAIHVHAEKAEGKRIVFVWQQPDEGPGFVLTLEDSVLLYTGLEPDSMDDAAVLTTSRSTLAAIAAGGLRFADALQSGSASVTGDAGSVKEFFETLEVFQSVFPIVLP